MEQRIAKRRAAVEGVELLLEFKPDVTLPDKEGRTAADYLSLIRPKAKRLEIAKKIEDL
jgi:hypothetical protein